MNGRLIESECSNSRENPVLFTLRICISYFYKVFIICTVALNNVYYLVIVKRGILKIKMLNFIFKYVIL